MRKGHRPDAWLASMVISAAITVPAAAHGASTGALTVATESVNLQQQDENPQESALSEFSGAMERHRPELIEIRRDIHRHPEPSGEEDRTAGIVADLLRDAGFEVMTDVGGHGVVGILRGGAAAGADAIPDGPILAFRADMDAVRGPADDPMEFRSAVPGVNHICGHDIHTTVGLALAAGLGEIRDRLSGTVVLIFQPAEETASGARAMLADGVFGASGGTRDRGVPGPPDAVFAYHTAPMPVGEVMTRAGTLLPGRDRVRIEIRGTDGADTPAGSEGRVDLDAAAHRVRAVVADAATAGSDHPRRPVSEDFAAVRGVRATNDGRGARVVVATLTTSSPDASRDARGKIERGLAALHRPGLELSLDYEEGRIAGVRNDPALVERSTAVARRVLGGPAVREPRTLTTVFSEDFGSFQRRSPGVMFFLGVSNPDEGWVGMPHSPTYVADDDAIFVGAEVMAAIFLDLFERGPDEQHPLGADP